VRLKEEVRLRQYSPKTLQTYRTWVNSFRGFLAEKVPEDVDSENARRFLTDLAVRKKVAASTQNQAFNALLFLFRHVLERDYDLKDKVVRARRSRNVPVVLSRAEVDAITGHLHGAKALAVKLLYGCGLRLSECLNLRVQHFNLDGGILTVRQGKGRKDRAVPLPELLLPDLKRQLEGVRRLHEEDLAAGYHGAFMPEALERKAKNAAKQLIWQWFFPARNLTFVPAEGGQRRYHLHETSLSTALRVAVGKSGVNKRVTSHLFRHTFASHLLRANYDIRTIQEMLGHSNVTTTMIYTHTMKSRTLKERRSPLDLRAEQVDELAPE
jgi:integron integrase